MFNEKTWTTPLKESLSRDVAEATKEILEAGLDSILEEGLLQNIPLLSTFVSTFRFGRSVKEAYDVRKLAIFLSQIQSHAASDKDIDAHLERISEANGKKSDKELEYIFAIVSSHVDEKKPKYLASLYTSYIENKIDWDSFINYVIILERLLPSDIETLIKGDIESQHYVFIPDSALRLVANGLMTELEDNCTVENIDSSESFMLCMPDSSTKNYKTTPFGKSFVDIVRGTI